MPTPTAVRAPATGTPAVPTLFPPSVMPSPSGPFPLKTRTSPTPTLVPLPLPTRRPDNTQWVRERLDAIIALYRPTPAGEALLHSLEVRQMKGEPGFFGSYGFQSWAGIGEAKPIPTMHELGHSYWGAFPIIGNSELGWQPSNGEAVAPALAAYHDDILTFMSQPPDEFELLRQRMRNLPGLSRGNTEPLFHSLEADVSYTTGGDLSLVPPILRKYWGYFLDDGPFGSWENAAGWYQALSHDKRDIAGKFLGFGHLDLDLYPGLPPNLPMQGLLSTASETLAGEERQRLTDLAEQFDLLIGDPQLEENFQFWREYLRDKVSLHRLHPFHLRSLSSERVAELANALSFVSSLEGSPDSRVARLLEQVEVQPLLVSVLPAVDDRTLVKLFAANPELPDGATLAATASFVDRLRSFGGLVEVVLSKGQKSPADGAREIRAFLEDTGLEREQDLRLFFDLFHSADRELAREIMNEVDKETVQALMEPVPTQLRAILLPEDLLEKLNISANEPEDLITIGITLLLEHTSGNYRIDEPFLERLFEVIAERVEADPQGAARIISETSFPLEGFILQEPIASTAVLSADSEPAIQLVMSSDPILAPPARIIYRLIRADPLLAAKLVAQLDESGEKDAVIESLAYFAYDKVRTKKYPRLPISLRQDGAFLRHLLSLAGPDWLADRLTESVATYRQWVHSKAVSPEFLNQYQQTLETTASLAPDSNEVLHEIIVHAFK